MSWISDRIGGVVEAGGNLFDGVRDAAVERAGDLAETAVETFQGAASLAEGYASRRGLFPQSPFLVSFPRLGRTEAGATGNGNGGDRQYDGLYVGAGGRTFQPSTPLSEVPPVLPSNGRVTTNETLLYVNGISTDKDAQARSLQQIADVTGARVVGVHNATQGMFVDLLQSAGDIADIGGNPAVDTLADTVYNEITAGRGVHLLAHSQGGLITSRALQDVYNRLRLEDGMTGRQAEALLSRVRVETFGSAAASYPNGPQYVHYINRLDIVPGAVGLGPFRLPSVGPVELVQPGRGAVVHRFNEWDNPHGLEETYLERRVPFEQARRGDFD